MVSRCIKYFPEYRGFTGTPQGLMGLHGLYWKRGGGSQVEGRAPKPNPNWGGGPPPFPSLPLPFPSPPSWTRKGGNLFLVGVGFPPWACPMRPVGPLHHSFIYGGGGTP